MIKGAIKTEKEYRKIPTDSSSSLKEFSLDRRKYYKKYVLGEKVEDDDNKATLMGRLVETLLFEKETFDDKFYLSASASAPTGLMLAFTEALYKRTLQATSSDGQVGKEFEDICKEAYADSGFKISFEKVMEKFIGSDAEIYYKEIREVRSKGLSVVTADDLNNGERIVQELLSNEFIGPILSIKDNSRYTVLIQQQVEDYEIEDLKLKSMMDLVIIDHQEKTIQCYDLKCVWAVENFYEEYYLYRRAYIQAYLYKEACRELKEQLDLEYYTVLNPAFIVCDSINYYNSLIYTLDSDDIDDAYNGFEHKGKKYPGVKDIIKDLLWARTMNKWTISRKNYLNMGRTNIKG